MLFRQGMLTMASAVNSTLFALFFTLSAYRCLQHLHCDTASRGSSAKVKAQTSVYCAFVVQQVEHQIHNKSARNLPSNPQQIEVIDIEHKGWFTAHELQLANGSSGRRLSNTTVHTEVQQT